MQGISFQKKLHKPFLILLLVCFHTRADAQPFPARNYPKGYFIYPVAARISLAANFGELRPDHYHMGLDCRTDQVQNKPVRAAADGYVARVSVAPGGFGQAIYLNHPNGLTTVYGHLNRFFPALERYVKEQQYRQESWRVTLDIPAAMFPVKQGQLIAYSGNTGGSQGPHCHFEIRDTRTGKVLNELLFGLPIPDKVPPSILRLAVYDRTVSTYSQVPRLFPLKKVPGGYTTVAPVITAESDRISFGISANDRQSGSNNPNGIYEAVLYLDGKPVSGFRLDSISYDETRYVNAHIDYRTRMAGGPYIEHLSRLPGYPEGVYHDFSGDGVIRLTDGQPHGVEIVVKDANGNASVLRFKLEKGTVTPRSSPGGETDPLEFRPGNVNVFENNLVQVVTTPLTLYDSFAFRYAAKPSPDPAAFSEVFSLASGFIPVQDTITVKIRPDRDIPPAWQDHMIIRQTWKSGHEVARATRTADGYTASFRAFGDFVLLADHVPPQIACSFRDGANLSKATRIVVVPHDDQHAISNFRATLDGRWLMFSNDKGRAFIYRFDDRCGRGHHELKVSVQDEAGNTAEKTYHFNR